MDPPKATIGSFYTTNDGYTTMIRSPGLQQLSNGQFVYVTDSGFIH